MTNFIHHRGLPPNRPRHRTPPTPTEPCESTHAPSGSHRKRTAGPYRPRSLTPPMISPRAPAQLRDYMQNNSYSFSAITRRLIS
jgi:hypothetical protein